MENVIRIETQRFVLRPLAADDADQVVSALNDFEVARWLTVVPHPYSYADYEGFLDHLTRSSPYGGLAIEETGKVIGVVGIDGSLGYWLGRDHHGRGVMKEAAGALVDHLFKTSDVREITSGHFPENDASRAVLMSLGFRDTGEIEAQHCVSRDCPETLIKMRLTRSDWEVSQ
ncbi:GNAT family N-acetyltransferase [Aliiroseovarius sp. F20344]|uniref:GNAT family N-acetyltransferase n=1 Tax=Aliiroseovarius sp. F20344 TaxID=2926414 RepID=UPI001FF6DCBC|nr:GNAT family N-acetyltransferase [Aliiroseovarius sp. F20344]MCK0143704.1 GNAT family N-acetyltransferase [Aliiroseovarius sp. F20344]